MFGGFNFLEIPRPFNTQYRCYSVSMLPGQERLDVERGGKIIMPPSALDSLTRLNIVYPMLFKLTNRKMERGTHSGVLEFVADEGKVYLPYWMMRNLLLDEGDLLQIESASLPVATFSKFQPQSPDFLDITNPKAVLENALRNFACLTKGDVIAITYNDRVYELCVLETKPGNAVSIIECDMNVDFAAPVGYSEPQRTTVGGSATGSAAGAGSTPGAGPAANGDDEMDTFDPSQFAPEEQGFVAFAGQGVRLDGKEKKCSSSAGDPVPSQKSAPTYQRGIPDYDYKIGSLRFLRYSKPQSSSNGAEGGDPAADFKAFSGQGQLLRKPRA